MKNWITSLTSPEACADWANAARLASTNYLIIANWGWVEALPAILSSGMQREATTPLNALPESRRRNVLEAMRRLEEFNENRAPRTAAGAQAREGVSGRRVAGRWEGVDRTHGLLEGPRETLSVRRR